MKSEKLKVENSFRKDKVSIYNFSLLTFNLLDP